MKHNEQHARWVRDFQRRHGLAVDGVDGRKTWRKVFELSDNVYHPVDAGVSEKLKGSYRTKQLSSQAMKVNYGKPGDESNLVTFTMPYTMYLYGQTSVPIHSHRCHKRVKAKIEKLLMTWLDELGLEYIRSHRLDHFDGVFNNRKTRGGSTKSRHAWGIAIDIDAAHNGNRTRWDADKVGKTGYATMPVAAINIANRLGWICGATAWGRDAMHFQAD